MKYLSLSPYRSLVIELLHFVFSKVSPTTLATLTYNCKEISNLNYLTWYRYSMGGQHVGTSLSNMIFCPCLSMARSSVCPHPSCCWQLPQIAKEDLIFWCGELALNKATHCSKRVSAAANVTVLSPDECDFWQMNAVTPSAVQQVTCPATCMWSTKGFVFQDCTYSRNYAAESPAFILVWFTDSGPWVHVWIYTAYQIYLPV